MPEPVFHHTKLGYQMTKKKVHHIKVNILNKKTYKNPTKQPITLSTVINDVLQENKEISATYYTTCPSLSPTKWIPEKMLDPVYRDFYRQCFQMTLLLLWI